VTLSARFENLCSKCHALYPFFKVLKFDDLIAQGSPITANHLNEDGFFPFYRIVYERVRLEGIVSVTNVLLMLKDDNEATLHLERFVEFRPALVLEPVSFESFGQESVAYYGLSSDRILDIYAIGIRERNLVGEVFILTVRGTADFDEMTEYIAIFAERLHEVATGAQ
jgi:hypothetical protein